MKQQSSPLRSDPEETDTLVNFEQGLLRYATTDAQQSNDILSQETLPSLLHVSSLDSLPLSIANNSTSSECSEMNNVQYQSNVTVPQKVLPRLSQGGIDIPQVIDSPTDCELGMCSSSETVSSGMLSQDQVFNSSSSHSSSSLPLSIAHNSFECLETNDVHNQSNVTVPQKVLPRLSQGGIDIPQVTDSSTDCKLGMRSSSETVSSGMLSQDQVFNSSSSHSSSSLPLSIAHNSFECLETNDVHNQSNVTVPQKVLPRLSQGGIDIPQVTDSSTDCELGRRSSSETVSSGILSQGTDFAKVQVNPLSQIQSVSHTAVDTGKSDSFSQVCLVPSQVNTHKKTTHRLVTGK